MMYSRHNTNRNRDNSFKRNDRNSPESSLDEKMKLMAVGAVSGYLGSYLEDIVRNFVNQKADLLEISSPASEHVNDIITGATVGLFSDRLNDMQISAFGSGLYYAVHRGIDQYLYRKERTQTELVQDFLMNTVIVFFLSSLAEAILKLMRIRVGKDADFVTRTLYGFVIGIPISIYYGAREKILFAFSGKSDREDSLKQKGKAKMMTRKNQENIVETCGK